MVEENDFTKRETGWPFIVQRCGPESEAKFADSQTNADLCVPSDWLASPRGLTRRSLHLAELHKEQGEEVHFRVTQELQKAEASEISSGQTLILKALRRSVHPHWIMQSKLSKAVLLRDLHPILDWGRIPCLLNHRRFWASIYRRKP